MKKTGKTLLLLTLVILLIGIASASEISENTTDTSSDTQVIEVDDETHQVSQTSTVTDEKDIKKEKIQSIAEDKNNKTVDKKLNTKITKEAEAGNWEHIMSEVDSAKRKTTDTTITLPSGNYITSYTIIWDNTNIVLTIDGNGQTINGNEKQLLYTYKGTTIILKNIIIKNATTNMNYGGAIDNNGNLTLINTTLQNNTAEYGGVIYNNGGTVTITDTTLQYNTAYESGGVIYNDNGGTVTITNQTTLQNNTAKYGGVIYNDNGGTVTITDTTLQNNTATSWGIIHNNDGTVTITDTTLQYNTANIGGAISNNYAGTVTITDSTLQYNTAYESGGAIYNDDGIINITNQTTLQNNTAKNGGAIYTGGRITINDSTLLYNTGEEGGGIYNSLSGIIDISYSRFKGNRGLLSGGAIFDVTNEYNCISLLYSNFTENIGGIGAVIYNYGNKKAQYYINHNIFKNNTADNKETLDLGTNSEKSIEENTYESTDILMSCGLTTHDKKIYYINGEDITLNFTIEVEHPEYYDKDISEKININTTNKTLYINGQENITTNRTSYTLSNLNHGIFDVNYTAYNQQSNTVKIRVAIDAETYVSNYTQLVEEINNATLNPYITYKINLEPGNYIATQSINWDNSETKKIIINGNGNTLDGQNSYQFIRIGPEHNLTLENIIITNYNATSGGAIYNIGNLTITNQTTLQYNTADFGGAIYNHGEISITNQTTLQYNTATGRGGAIFNNYGNISIYDSKLKNNTATEGGVIYDFTRLDYNSRIVLYDSNFTENTATNGSVIQNNEVYGNYSITLNKFQKNMASQNKETLNLGTNSEKSIKENTYENTDISITNNLTIYNQKTFYTYSEDITLNSIIEVEHPEYYDKDISEKININTKTLYINGQENITTNKTNITLKYVKPGEKTIYLACWYTKSNNVSFTVVGDSQIKTDKNNYDYYDGMKNTITLNIIDPSEEKGTISIGVKEGNEYNELLLCPKIQDGYLLTIETIKYTLENIYTKLENTYIINISYNSNNSFVSSSSTEFTLYFNKQRNTTVIYDILNNTEGNVEINITVLDTIYNTPIDDTIIQITGDITENTTNGIITDYSLSPGEYTLNLYFEGNNYYHSSNTKINLNVEVDKDKIINQLEELVKNFNNTIQEQKNTITDLNSTIQEQNNTINNLNKINSELKKQLDELTSQVIELTKTVKDLNKTIAERDETIKELTTKIDTKITVNKINTTTYSSTVIITGTLTDKNGKALNNMPVSIKINTATTKVVTDTKGTYKYTGTAGTVGINNVTVTFTDNDKYKAISTKTSFKVNKATPTLKINSIASVKFKDKVTITGSLMDANNKAISTANITLKINNKTVTVKTGKDGSFKYTTTATSMGTNNVTATYNGNSKYNKVTAKASFKVDKQDLVLTVDRVSSSVLYKDNIEISGKLVDGNGKAIGNTIVSVKVNSKTYKAKTDKNGVYVLKLRATEMGTSNVTVSYNGNTKYNKASVKTTFKVDKQDIIIGFDTIKYSNGKVTIQGTFTDRNRHVLMNSLARITLNGKQGTAKTDINGTFTYTTKANKGTYKVTLAYPGNAHYNAYSKTTTVNTA